MGHLLPILLTHTVPSFVTVRDNHLCSRRDKSVIQVRSEPYGKPSRTQDIVGIEIVGNHFAKEYGVPSPFIKLDHVRHVVIRNNVFDNQGHSCCSPIYCWSGSGLDMGDNSLNGDKQP